MAKSRLLLAEDHRLVAESLKVLLSRRYQVMDIVTDGAEVVPAVHRLQPDVLLLDLSLPNRHGADILRELTADLPSVRVLVVTMHGADEVGREVMRLGAFGFLQKNASSVVLFAAIEEVLAGHRVSPVGGIAKPVVASVYPPPGFFTLTATQQTIVCLIGKGLTSVQIARQLRRSRWTIHSHRKRIRRILGFSNELQMHRFALDAANSFPTGTETHQP